MPVPGAGRSARGARGGGGAHGGGAAATAAADAAAAASGSGGGMGQQWGAPGEAARRARAAHEAAVTGLIPLPGGQAWLSAGGEGRLRLWDARTWHNLLVSFGGGGGAGLRGARAHRLAASDDGRTAFVPLGNNVQVYDVRTGAHLHSLAQGHYGPVRCCAFSSALREVFSGGDDGQLLVWTPGAMLNDDDA
ncbi:hypothetical protein FOA52_015623 [Chlamydomonas sp. UWO 241]|nr:hypothetical protein FOA52_015623 [Chlamydomonas sp. UWO 241]